MAGDRSCFFSIEINHGAIFLAVVQTVAMSVEVLYGMMILTWSAGLMHCLRIL
jgi:hypothetical protein